jgi:hypothetical protein
MLIVAFIRFINFITIAYYWSLATTHRDLVLDHAELRAGAYDKAIVTGAKIVAEWISFAVFYTFTVWVTSLPFMPPLNLPFLVMDTLITVYVSQAVHYQSVIVPGHKSDCYESGFHRMQRPAGVNESFFEAAARLDGARSKYAEMCVSFVEERKYGIMTW